VNKRDIRAKARDYIRQAAQGSFSDLQPDPENPGYTVSRVFLGSLINPSGKFYTPWANSNVQACPRCQGRGTLTTSHICPACDGSAVLTVQWILDHSNEPREACIARLNSTPACIWITPGETFHCWACNHTGKQADECAYCGGQGSREAFEDSLFWEFLDEFAAAAGGYIESGEGDPCDTFYCVSFPVVTFAADEERAL